jgi:hypothetical protein
MPGLIALAVGQPVGPGNEHGSMAGGAHAVEWVRIRYIPFTGSTSGSLPPSCWWLSPLGWPSPLGLRGAPPKAGTSAHAASTATSQPAPPTSPATATASAPTATQALATFAGDVTLIRRDRRGHRPRYRPDHFHPGCQGPATGGHGDRPRTHGMENGSFEQPGGSVLRADLSALAAARGLSAASTLPTSPPTTPSGPVKGNGNNGKSGKGN